MTVDNEDPYTRPKGTSGGIRHANMHPATRVRVNARAEFGRAQGALISAHILHAKGEVTDRHVARKNREANEALDQLVQLAIAEGAA